MKQRLLFITWHELDRISGGPKASLGFIHCFASLFPGCSVIYRQLGDASPLLPQGCQPYPCHDTRSRLQKGMDMYRGILHPLHQHVVEHLREHRYDLIVIDHSITAASFLRLVRASCTRLITIHHNVERDYLRDNRQEYPLAYRLPYLHYARKAERDCLLRSDVNLTVTARDAATFRSWPKGQQLHVHPWGIFEHLPIADKQFSERRKGHSFIITGSLCFMQSLHPILEFIDRYWPLLRQVCPQATLTIAGRDPAPALQQASSRQEGIAIVPNPADMAALVAEADYYVCPINAGSGLKLRVMDGLRQGLPVLCHEVSAAGYERLASCGCLFPYRDEASFQAALRQMLAEGVPPQKVYRTYQQTFSTKAGVESLRQILQEEHISTQMT